MPRIIGAIRAEPLFTHEAQGPHDEAAAAGITLIRLHHKRLESSADRLLAAYRTRGVAAIHERGDDCAVVLFDEPNRRLIVSRDRVGIHPVQYMSAGGTFCFGTLIADILRTGSVTARPNRGALAGLLVHGSAAGVNQTYFENVHALPPAATLIRDERGIQIQTGDVTSATPRVPTSFADAAEQFRVLFRDSVIARSSQSQTSVLVSGGLDSAAIISCAPSAFGITYGPGDESEGDESRYIAVLRAAGHVIHDVAFDPVVTFTALEQNIRDGEAPYADDVPATLARAAACAREKGATALLIGTWGDQVLSPFPPPHLQNVGPWRVWQLARASRAFGKSMTDVQHHTILRALLRQSTRSRLPRAALRMIRRTRPKRQSVFDLLLNDFPEHHYAEPPRNYGEAVRHSYSSPEQVEAIAGTMKWGLGQDLEVALPFLDYHLLQLLTALPDAVAYHNNELKPILRAAMRGVVPEPIRERRDKGDYTRAIRARMLDTRKVVESLDRLERVVEFGLMSPSAARATLAKLSPAGNIAEQQADLASILLGLDTWLRIFFKAEI